MEAAVEHVRLHKPRVLYLALGETDEWAHGRKYELYARAAHKADAFLAGFWAMLQSMPEYQGSTSLISTTDHGRGAGPDDWTSHGQKIAGAAFIWIALGPDIPAKGVPEKVAVTQSQIAAKIGALVGEDFRAASPRSAAPLPILAP